MAYLKQNNSAAVFSPSVARFAANTARDWSYIDSWLASVFSPGRTVPAFERNATTLGILLAIAEANEVADESYRLLADVNGDILQRLSEHDALHAMNRDLGVSAQHLQPKAPSSTTELRTGLLGIVERNMTNEGRTALDSLVSTASQNGMIGTHADSIGLSFLELQTSAFELTQSAARVDGLCRHIQLEGQKVEGILAMLKRNDCNLPSSLGNTNLNMQRKVEAVAAQLIDVPDQSQTKAPQLPTSVPSVQAVVRVEQEFLTLLANKKELEGQIAKFQGLPSDPERARDELDSLRQQLQAFTCRRDQVFEGLVQRESPMKKR